MPPVRTERDFAAMEQRRKRAAQLFARGVTQADVARELGVSRQSVSRWHADFTRGGAVALRGAGRAGRKPKLDGADLGRIEQALLRGAVANGYRTELWTLPRITEVIEVVTGVTYHPGHVWRLMAKLGWSPQRPQRLAKERDDEAVATWVRERWPVVKKTPGDGARSSSSRTSPASR
jgi:transposase